MFKHQNKDQQPKSRGRWKDEDEGNSSLKQTVPKVWNSKGESSSHPFSDQQHQPKHAQPQPQRLIQSKPQPKKDESFQLEQRLLDDILQPTGISIRPSDHLLNEFFKRAKNLDRDKIFNGLMDKLLNYQSYITHQESVKTLTKCLFVVDHLVQNKLEDIYESFEERQDLFSSIKDSYPINKKINELCNSIINAYGGTQLKANNQHKDNQIQNKNANVLLLDIAFPEQDTNNNNEDILNQNDHPMDTRNDLFADLFEANHNHNQKQSVSQINIEDAIEPKKNQVKGFSFIKVKGNNPQADEQKIQPSFIKPKSSTIQSELVNLFNNVPSSNSNANGVPLINLANNSSSQQLNAPVDLTKIAFTNAQPQGPKFNYDLVYENTNVLKEKHEKDPFNFVNDMIKSKKS